MPELSENYTDIFSSNNFSRKVLINNTKNTKKDFMIDAEKICEIGVGVVLNEGSAIRKLVPRINKDFVDACRVLSSCRGHIIVTGMGKSGHIGKKIAATLSSIGAPAFFMHPAEASHGDLGMVTRNDAMLAISNSGETIETLIALSAIKHLKLPIISLTGNLNSAIAKLSTINLDISIKKEACPLGVAPTTSSTLALVMGDAIAMVLLELRGFTTKDFARIHPGGNLGAKFASDELKSVF